MMNLDKSKKDLIFSRFNEEYEPAESSAIYNLLNPIKETDQDLYNIGCKLDNSYKMRQMLPEYIGESNSINKDDFCSLLNEWLNSKKIEYISGKSDCESNTELWEQKIEILWSKLKESVGEGESCERYKVTYNCSISPEFKTPITLCFMLLGIFLIIFFFLYKFSPLGSRIHNCLNRKKRILQNTVPEVSCKLLERSSENEISHFERERINIGYYYSGN
ncbi:PIR protein [Plasmodium malariae]|uniref:PIR protein n=1 Tax=Plasmodium malariae TaxID=5858 RepID=A0A1D3JH10_PLAMA|nr:PIR protein [Plasmodium malariae]SBT85478.1 PIR protein [Plasmodium malariae]